jgi:hypothetical protein
LVKALVTATFPGSNPDVKSTTSSIASDEFVDSADHSLDQIVDQAMTSVSKPPTGIEPETLGNYFVALSTDLQTDLPADMPWHSDSQPVGRNPLVGHGALEGGSRVLSQKVQQMGDNIYY